MTKYSAMTRNVSLAFPTINEHDIPVRSVAESIELTHDTFHVVGAAVLQEQVDQHDRDEEGDRFKVGLIISSVPPSAVNYTPLMPLHERYATCRAHIWGQLNVKVTHKEQSQIPVNSPGDNDQQRNHPRGNLDRATHRHTQHNLHLALTRHPHRRHMLRRITHQRQQNEPNEPLGNLELVGRLVDRPHQDVRRKRRGDRDDHQPQPGGPLVHIGFFLLFAIFDLGFE